MSHNIDMSNDRANVAYAGQVPWHGLGGQLEEGATIDEWQEAAGLSWSAIAATVKFDSMHGRGTFDGRNVLYRSDTQAPLSIVSDRYKIVQPKQVIEFFREFVEAAGGLTMEVAGSLDGGCRVWALAKGSRALRLSKADVTEQYLLLATSFDMSLPTIAQPTSVRVVCNNTLHLALDEQKGVRVPHSTAFDPARIKADLGLDERWLHFSETATRLADTKMTKSAAGVYFYDVFYPEKVQASQFFSQKSAEKRVKQLMDIHSRAPGQETLAAKGTVWGALNAVTYYADHVARTRTGDRRLCRAWFGDNADAKARALSLASAVS